MPFDPRLISAVPMAVAKAAMETGVARKPIVDMEKYAQELNARRDPIASTLSRIYDRVRRKPQRVVFAEGEEEQVMRAAVSYVSQRLGTASLVGREEIVRENARLAGVDLQKPGIEIINARLSRRNAVYTDYLYERVQRKGFFRERAAADQQRPQPFRRLHGGAGRRRRDGDGHHLQLFDRARRYQARHRRPSRPLVIGGRSRFAGRTALVADTAVHDMPNAVEIADIAEEAAGFARRMGYEPRAAMLAYSTFGHPAGERPSAQEAQKSSTSAASTSSMTARWRPTSRSTPR